MTRSEAKTKLESLSRLLCRFRDAREGVAAIEAAIVLPVMALAYIGMVNFAQMVMINRKVTQLTSTLSDLTARLKSVPTTEISNIFKAAETVVLPYDASKVKMVIASVVIDADRVSRICWASSYPDPAAAPKRGDAVTLPDSARVANTSVIMAAASYDFTPLIANDPLKSGLFKKVTLGNKPIFSRPRNGKADGNANIEQIVRSDVKGCPNFS